MKYPKSLDKGGRIGFVAPSFGCSIEPYYSAFQNALNKWEKLGYQVWLGPNVYANEGIGISNTPQKCAKEWMEGYLSKDADVLISCGGGELMCEILDYIDFQAIREADPKWFLGYSDNTNIIYLLATLCDTAAIYGPCAAAFGMEPWHEAIGDAYELLTGKKHVVKGYDLWEKESQKDAEHPLLPYYVTEPRQIKAYNKGVFMDSPDKITREIHMSGRLLGGCMDCLVNLLGTKYDKTEEFTRKYEEDGILWFLEACDLNVFSIRRAMWQMEHAGWFRNVRGFLIGRPLNGEAMFQLDAYEAVLAMASKHQVPVIMDLDIGHVAPMMPLIVGSMAKVSVLGNDIEIEMEYR